MYNFSHSSSAFVGGWYCSKRPIEKVGHPQCDQIWHFAALTKVEQSSMIHVVAVMLPMVHYRYNSSSNVLPKVVQWQSE